ncbi:hypothetical protein HK100_001901 [Physocladia obscura]|uniref:Uncharacterized protein n=1 Tax=Physocladia obscura TaxID=109957 RepID=A0AAD5XFU1_9FUNG|nr:hypothetical protein HK100_001901 [Physocladia obscura]
MLILFIVNQNHNYNHHRNNRRGVFLNPFHNFLATVQIATATTVAGSQTITATVTTTSTAQTNPAAATTTTTTATNNSLQLFSDTINALSPCIRYCLNIPLSWNASSAASLTDLEVSQICAIFSNTSTKTTNLATAGFEASTITTNAVTSARITITGMLKSATAMMTATTLDSVVAAAEAEGEKLCGTGVQCGSVAATGVS